MSKYWVCDKCLPEEVEELTIGPLMKTPCVICGEDKEPAEVKCVRSLPERLEKILIKRGDMIKMTVEVTDYDEKTCITAGKLRACGIAVPSDIPDCAWVPKYAMKFGEPKCSMEPDNTGTPALACSVPITFTEPFRWVRVDTELEDMKNKIAAGMGIPKEYLEPTLTGHASLLVAMDKEISKMLEEEADKHSARIIEELKKP